MARRGKRPECTPQMRKAICDNIICGLTNHDSAVLAGVSEGSFYAWLKRGEVETARLAMHPHSRPRKYEARYVEFLKAVEKAKSQRKSLLLSRIQKAAKGGEQFTETKRTFKAGELTEEVITVKQMLPEWTAAAWLLERIHPQEFARRQRVDVFDWRQEVTELLKSGAITADDVYRELGEEYATQVLESAGISILAPGKTQKVGTTEEGQTPTGVA